MSDVSEKILALLRQYDVPHRVMDHPAVFTSEEAARVRGTKLEQAAKALVFWADGSPLLFVVPGDRRVDTKAFKKLNRVKDLRMATREEVEEMTGLTPGSIPPFGRLFGLPVYFDEALLTHDRVVFNAGSHTRSIEMPPQSLVCINEATVGNYSCY
mgnify:CR=1 FL=1